MTKLVVLLRLAIGACLLVALTSCSGGASEGETPATVQLKLCSTGSLVADVPSYNSLPGTPPTVNWTAGSTCQLANPEYAFWMQDPSGTWTNVRPYGTVNTYAWPTTGQPVGAYNWTVWVREAGSTSGGWEAYGYKGYYLNASPRCATGSVTANPASPSVGTNSVLLTTTTSTCSNPLYQYYIKPPGQGFALARPWGASTYNWDTTALPPGTYEISVWIKDQQSPAQYDTYAYTTYVVLGSATCTQGRVSASPNPPALGTNPAVLTASASSCSSPQYQYYIKPPGQGFALARAWGAATYNWDTSGLTPGTYEISVWVRDQGSPNQYDTYGYMAYTVLAAPTCTAGSVSAMPASPQSLGTPITLTASSSTCNNPQYQFWMQPPGGGFSVVQPWGGPTYNWNTGPLASGTYIFSVWIKDATSPQAYDTYGQLYYTLSFTSPGSNVTNFSAGLWHTCAARADGTIDCWGYNPNGELGNGTTINGLVPTPVSGITTAASVVSGYNHSCAVLTGGTVSCWGLGTSGQLGNGANSSSTSPVSVSGITNATAVAVGAAHTCALLSDGTVRCWGYSSQGAIGNGSTGTSNVPVTVANVSGAVAVSAGYYHSCAVLSNGTVKCWGGNSFGELGNGTNTMSTAAVTVSNLQDVVALSSSSGHNCALLANHTVKCWGYNLHGGNGDGSVVNSNVPQLVSGLNNAVSISVSPDHGCAALQTGAVQCWGLNDKGQLGDGSTTESHVPVTVAGLTGTTATTVATGWFHSCALFADNTVNCWGYNQQGELGNNSHTDSTVPVVTTLP